MLIAKMGLPRRVLAGKVAVVTGAGRGIGRELARALAWLGARVIIAEVEKTGAQVEALMRAEGGDALFIQTDVGEERSVRALASRALETFGRVDILVNNAILYRTGSLLELSLNDWDQTYAVNLRGAVAAIEAFLPGMLERGEGVIVTMTSQEGMPYAAPYFASKAALRSLGLSLAAELGEKAGVYSFVFAPGMVDTPGGQEAFRAMAPRFGMSFEQFTSMGTNPGYEGLMPAEDCAAGLAYAIVHARQYHGQVADPFRALAKAGLLPVADLPQGLSGAAQGEIEGPSTGMSVTASFPSSTAIQCAEQLHRVLVEVKREFDELDMFRRMYARRDFQRKVGISIDDWLETAAGLVTDLEALAGIPEAGTREAKVARRIGSGFPWLRGNLVRLADYFRKTMKDAEGFIQDPQALAAALDALDQRERVVRSLLAALEEEMRLPARRESAL